MKIHEILVESQQLDEGPMLNKIGSAIGKGVGTLAKGVGAVAGGVVGAGTAMKKGFQAGKDTVAQAGDDEPASAAPATTGAPAAPATTGAPAAGAPIGGPTAQPAAGDVNKAGPAGTAAAKPLQGAAKVAADKTAAATAGQDQAAAGQTMYAQVKANIDKLDKKGKQRILQLLQKSLTAAPAAAEKPAAGGDAMGAMASQLGGKPANTMANAPVSATNTAKPGNPNAAPAAEPTAAAPTVAPAAEPTAPGKVLRKPRALKQPAAGAAPAAEPTAPAAEPKKRAPRKQAAKAPTQAEIDADRDKIMGVTSDSIVRRQPALAEGFSLFRKRA
jgi:hypothetical protein